MCGKLISIFLLCLFAFYLLITPVSAQNTAIKWYKFDEGIDLAKSTGKPIAISLGDFLVGSDEKTYSEINNNFINIYPVLIMSDEVSSYISLVILTNTGSITQPGMSKGRGVQVLILDSNGREITRIDNQNDIKGFNFFVQFDADGKEIGRIENSGETERKKVRDFFYYAYKYAENKNGKIQRLSQEILPREMDLISVNELLTDTTGKYAFAYVTISGYIRDIKSERTASGSAYTFAIDDGTSAINLWYNGGLGNIKEGDKVFVRVLTPHREYKYGRTMVSTVSKDKIPTKVNPASSDGSPSAPKTPGFGVTIGVVAIFFVSRKIIKRR